MRIYCMLGGKTILGHFCFWSKGGFSLFSKNAFLFLFLSPLYGVAVCTFIYTKNQIFEKKKEAIGRLECYCIYISMEQK